MTMVTVATCDWCGTVIPDGTGWRIGYRQDYYANLDCCNKCMIPAPAGKEYVTSPVCDTPPYT